MIDEVIALAERKVGLLKELKESMAIEKCDYHVVQLPRASGLYNEPLRFIMYETATNAEVRYGTPKEIRTWLERRKIPAKKVYGYHLIAQIVKEVSDE